MACTFLAAMVVGIGPALAARAALKLGRSVGPPSTTVRARGRGFQPGEVVALDFDDLRVGSARAGGTGMFSQDFEVPDDALPGTHEVAATGDSSGSTATTSFLVRTDWPLFHFDPANSGFDPFENVIDPSNVASLVPRWTAGAADYVSVGPVVSDGLLYAASYYARVFAYDATTGQQIWVAPTDGLIASGPAVSQGRLFIEDLDGDLYAFSASTGNRLWKTHVGFAGVPGAGGGAVAIASGDVVYVNGGSTYAIDAATGATLWVTVTGGFGEPAVGEEAVYLATFGQVVALDRRTGAVTWSAYNGEKLNGGDPVVSGGLVYLGNYDKKVRAHDATTGATVWAGVTNGFVTQTTAADGNSVYASSYDNHLFAFDEVDGTIRWKASLTAAATAPIVANGVVYATSGLGHIQAYDATDGSPLWSSTESVSDAPIVVNGMLYAAAESGGITAFGLP